MSHHTAAGKRLSVDADDGHAHKHHVNSPVSPI